MKNYRTSFRQNQEKRIATIEPLEARQLLSAAPLSFRPGHLAATVGIDSSGPVAIVVGKNVPTSASDYQASIDWGDSSAADTDITVATTKSGKAVQLIASHVYTNAASDLVTVTIFVDGQLRGTVRDRVRVRPFPALPHPIRTQSQVAFSGAIGTLLKPLPAGNNLTIDWGDGTIDVAAATPQGKRMIVNGSHAYDQPGKYSVTVFQSIGTNGTGGEIDAVILKEPAIVRSTPFSTSTIRAKAVDIQPVTGVAITTVPAKLVGVPASVQSATVQIDWGDGTPIDTVSATNSGGTIVPADSHIYQQDGTYKAVVTFMDGAQTLGSASETFTVSQISSGGMQLSAIAGTVFAGPVGSITHQYPELALETGQLIAPGAVGVEWGDGTRSLGTAIYLGNDQFQLTGVHTYAKPGIYAVKVVGGTGSAAPWPIPGQPELREPASPVSIGELFTTTQSLMTVTGSDVFIPPQPVTAAGLPISDVHTGTLNTVPIAELSGLGTDPYRAAIYAVVDWGDGSSDAAGPITDFENGVFVLRDGHQYSAGGTFTISVTFMLNDHTDTSQNTVLAHATASVNVLP